jgi:hypothetical protein
MPKGVPGPPRSIDTLFDLRRFELSAGFDRIGSFEPHAVSARRNA